MSLASPTPTESDPGPNKTPAPGKRTIRRGEFVSCTQAFIDCWMPGSETKENYSMIGPGVTQNPDQVVNLREPHGFNIGAAAMPHGVTNNLHLHFTAEVFLNFNGDWRLRWGNGGTDGEHVSHRGDIVSIPTWVFRGFTNEGPDDGWLFTVLGGDDTGGIIWDPAIIRSAGEQGLYLTRDSVLIDTSTGSAAPTPDQRIAPMSDADLAGLERWPVEKMAERVIGLDSVGWSEHAFLCSTLPGGGAHYGPVIGPGMSEDRRQQAPITNPHQFCVGWLRATEGDGLLEHTLDVSSVVIVYQGQMRVVIDDEDQTPDGPLEAYDMVSIPPASRRRLQAVGREPLLAVVVTAGDGRARPAWSPEVTAAASDRGWVLDRDGYIAPSSVVGLSTIDD